MATTSVARQEPAHTAQQDPEIEALAQEISHVEGVSLTLAARIAAAQLPRLRTYAEEWDRQANVITTLDPSMAVLAGSMKLQFSDDPAAQRAVDRAMEQLQVGAVYEFDGVELRILSFSRRKDGIWHVSDGEFCTCEAGKRPWCKHRALYRLLLAQMSLREPGLLRVKILEQNDPGDDFPPDSILD